MAEHKKKFLDFWVVRLEQWHIGVCMETQTTRESLHNKREYEHYRKATPEYIELLLKTVEQSPSETGYEFGTLDEGEISYIFNPENWDYR